jgi:formiminotetrahydrofolate cyclodeaminase
MALGDELEADGRGSRARCAATVTRDGPAAIARTPLYRRAPMTEVMAESSLSELLARLAGTAPAPGAGSAAAWTCALAAALLEMVLATEVRREPGDAPGARRRRDRAAALRAQALALADTDVAAYRAVLEVKREGDLPGHAARLQDALSAAADPPVAIAEAAAEVARFAADGALRARGGIRGEAIAAVALAEAAAATCVTMVELNLGGAPEDPRLERVRSLARDAASSRGRA